MKKLTYLFLAFLIVACSDDQGNNANDDSSNEPILGTWSLVSWELDGQIQNLDSCDFLSYIMFNSDLSFERMWYETISGDCIIEGNDTGSYLYNTDNNLIIPEYIINFKNKSKKTVELIEHFEKLKNLEQQKKEENVIEFKNKKKFKKKPFKRKKFFKKAK